MMVTPVAAVIAVVVAWFLYYAVLPVSPVKRPRRSVQITESQEGESGVWRCADYPDRLVERTDESIHTMPDLLDYCVEKYGSKDALGIRTTVKEATETHKQKDKEGKTVEKKMTIPWQTDYKWRSYEQFGKEAKQFGAGLAAIAGKDSKPGDKICMYASTRPEWQIAAHGCWQQALVVATCYPSLGPDALKHTLKQCDVGIVITEKKLLANTLHKVIDDLPSLKTIVYMDNYDHENKFEKKIKELQKKHSKYTFISFDDVLKKGEGNKSASKKDKIKAEDTAVIMYTSGSTGTPKGVVISHASIIAATAPVQAVMPELITSDDTYIAFLPLAHILELAAEAGLLAFGARLGYSTPQTLRDDQVKDENGKGAGDLATLRPSIMAMVPAVAEKLRTAINDQVTKAGVIATAVLKGAMYLKKRNFLRGQSSPILNAIIFNKIAAKFGGKLKAILSGGAPLNPETQMFITLAFNCPVSQGYGLTETCGSTSVSRPEDVIFGHVGGVIPDCEVKLKDCPDMGYRSTDTDKWGRPTPRGEILIRGPCISKGYFQMDDKTKESFKSGKEAKKLDSAKWQWFESGDVGMFDSDGNLHIVDRKKDLVKLKHGEYIALGNIESQLAECEIVESIMLHGNGTVDAPVALICVKENALKKLGNKDIDSLLSDESIEKKVIEQMKSAAGNVGKGEMPCAIKLLNDEWTPESGLVTEAMKIKRKPVEEKYEKELEELYKKAGGKFKE